MKTQEIISLDGKPTNYKNLYNDKGEYLSTVSLKYKPLLHEDLSAMVKKAITGLGIEFNLQESYPHSGRDAFLKFTLEGFNKDVKPQIVLRNTLKPGKALKLYTGAFTMACSNGSIRGTKFSTFTHTHVAYLREELFMSQVEKFAKSYPEHIVFLEKLKAQEANVDAFFLNWEQSERDEKAIRSMFDSRACATATVNRTGNSLHDLYQTATEFYSHNKLSEDSKIKRLSYVEDKFNQLVGV